MRIDKPELKIVNDALEMPLLESPQLIFHCPHCGNVLVAVCAEDLSEGTRQMIIDCECGRYYYFHLGEVTKEQAQRRRRLMEQADMFRENAFIEGQRENCLIN